MSIGSSDIMVGKADVEKLFELSVYDHFLVDQAQMGSTHQGPSPTLALSSTQIELERNTTKLLGKSMSARQ